ncbi:disulfide bond formation protein B [Marinicella gelatinilytica]|uniref:disulfide bond formation protein B n=1 Tax=Marinicella gelatinilytica TaxID=2996017 RepID=UPI002260CBA5|nr:disulfide bond formation protein B [Marinicella gelatinilytica]MCX7546179.1 disulfide bond formation protein B [Marinicella gelatinilytica]
MSKNLFRLITLLPFLLCAGLIAYALYVEHVDFLMPCNLCILQRVVYIVIGAIFLIAAFKPTLYWGRKLVGILALIISAIGIAISGRHVWMQSLPADQVPDCGPSLQMMLDSSPLLDVLKSVLSGSGNCAEIQWQFLGMSMPTWSLIMFIGLFIFSLLWMFLRVTTHENTNPTK